MIVVVVVIVVVVIVVVVVVVVVVLKGLKRETQLIITVIHLLGRMELKNQYCTTCPVC